MVSSLVHFYGQAYGVSTTQPCYLGNYSKQKNILYNIIQCIGSTIVPPMWVITEGQLPMDQEIPLCGLKVNCHKVPDQQCGLRVTTSLPDQPFY